MATTTQNRIHPGLLCRSIEFFTGKNGKLKVLSGGKVREFSNSSYTHHQILKEAIAKEPETFKLLNEWYPHSELKRLIQFGSCRFGGLDYEPDVIDFKLQEGEYISCPVRHLCPGAGVLCQTPRYKGTIIEFNEVKIIQALATTDTNEAIADNLGMALGSFHLAKKILYDKLKIQTKQEAVLIGRDLNLL
jgi:DNA-binding CsgD family transcriptional regulator